MFSCFSNDKKQAKLNKSANVYILSLALDCKVKKRSSIVNSCHFIHKHTLSSILAPFIINEYLRSRHIAVILTQEKWVRFLLESCSDHTPLHVLSSYCLKHQKSKQIADLHKAVINSVHSRPITQKVTTTILALMSKECWQGQARKTLTHCIKS